MPVLPDTRDAGWAVVGPGDDDSGSKIGNWSSLIGIITSIVGNILIALALNVQRYSHIQLGKRKAEARERAKEALRRAQNGGQNGYGATEHARTPHDGYVGEEDDVLESHPLSHSAQSGHSSWSGTTVEDDNKVSSSYLKSPSWWLGQILMTVGEMGNFLAYGFAPASIVSPLGVVALISNCVIAPIFFGEIFRARDFWGVVIAVGGAVTVVLSAKQEETKLDPHNVWDAISTMEFEIYVGVSVLLIIVLMWASPRYGNRSILIDLGLVGLFGGYTALSTKGVSSMLSSTLWRAFTTPVTYGLLVVLLGTAVMQVRYVNKALQRFDSTQVIPIQFVLFTLSVIIGSAILYRDFERTTVEQALKFIGGCLLTFFGVFLITSGRPQQHDDDELSDDDNVEETIGLRDQEASSMAHGAKPNEHVSAPVSKVSSRRSSRGSRVSFADASARPLITRHDSGVPSARKPEASAARGSLGPTESTSLLNNPWRNSVDDQAIHPGLGAPVFSDDSVVTIHSVTTTNTANTDPLPSGAVVAPSLVAPPPNAVGDRPVTPRPSFSSSRPHSRHYSKNSIISPSPLSSTVTAVVADALNRGDGNTLGRRRSIRRLQPSIRNSLFMPSDEDADEPLLESEPLIRPAATEPNLATAAADLDDARVGRGEQQGLRGRARSVSNTLGDLFSRTKKRRNTNPEVGSCGAGQPNPEDVTEGGSRVETGPPGDYGDRGERHHT